MIAVYPFRHSAWRDNELRYSLRSLEKHFAPLSGVLIVGDKPDWLIDVDHLRMRDPVASKALNIWAKLREVARYLGPGVEFIYMNDDFYLLKDCETMPDFYSGCMQSKIKRTPGSPWVKMLIETVEYLHGAGMPTRNHAVHFPVICNTDGLKELIGIASENILSFRCLWGNIYGENPVEHRDVKLRRDGHKPIPDSWPCFSTGDQFRDHAKMTALYPEKSRYEGDGE